MRGLVIDVQDLPTRRVQKTHERGRIFRACAIGGCSRLRYAGQMGSLSLLRGERGALLRRQREQQKMRVLAPTRRTEREHTVLGSVHPVAVDDDHGVRAAGVQPRRHPRGCLGRRATSTRALPPSWLRRVNRHGRGASHRLRREYRHHLARPAGALHRAGDVEPVAARSAAREPRPARAQQVAAGWQWLQSEEVGAGRASFGDRRDARQGCLVGVQRGATDCERGRLRGGAVRRNGAHPARVRLRALLPPAPLRAPSRTRAASWPAWRPTGSAEARSSWRPPRLSRAPPTVWRPARAGSGGDAHAVRPKRRRRRMRKPPPRGRGCLVRAARRGARSACGACVGVTVCVGRCVCVGSGSCVIRAGCACVVCVCVGCASRGRPSL
eukprot:scaffold21217_cov28-Tisochrysis_lutea.AAC.2